MRTGRPSIATSIPATCCGSTAVSAAWSTLTAGSTCCRRPLPSGTVPTGVGSNFRSHLSSVGRPRDDRRLTRQLPPSSTSPTSTTRHRNNARTSGQQPRLAIAAQNAHRQTAQNARRRPRTAHRAGDPCSDAVPKSAGVRACRPFAEFCRREVKAGIGAFQLAQAEDRVGARRSPSCRNVAA